MYPDKIIIKFTQSHEQTNGPVMRIVGFVQAKDMLSLFDSADLEANPRSAKTGTVTDDIMESIHESTDLFPFKTKGVLVGASHYRALQRRRYELEFIDPLIEGILDGGHNMLAIGLYFLSQVIEDDKELRRIKQWGDFNEAWNRYRSDIDQIKNDLDFLIPVEVIVPSDLEDDDILSEFNMSLLDICAARNNNVQLTLETTANKKGFYDEIRKALPTQIADRVEWKTNDGGKIKVRDLIALAWIPLSKVDLPVDVSVSPQNIYRNKGECSKQFDRLMRDDQISSAGDGYARQLHNKAVHSAIKILGDLPELYDQIYRDFPEAYNRGTNGRFGRTPIVQCYEKARINEKNPKYLRQRPRTKFGDETASYKYPDGLIMPLVFGLSALMEVDKNGEIQWKTPPHAFLDNHLEAIAEAYKFVLDMSLFDPQKISKNETSYKIAVNEFEKALLKQEAQARSFS